MIFVRHWKPGISLHFGLEGSGVGLGVSGMAGGGTGWFSTLGLQQKSSGEVHIPVKDDMVSVFEHPCNTIIFNNPFKTLHKWKYLPTSTSFRHSNPGRSLHLILDGFFGGTEVAVGGFAGFFCSQNGSPLQSFGWFSGNGFPKKLKCFKNLWCWNYYQDYYLV